MLLQLLIKNIALIDQIELSFGKGLHVLTGETGAGKSIVVDAVNLLLGSRADRELIRTGCEKAYAEGLFDLSDCAQARAWLDEHDFEYEDDSLILAREISQNGRGVCRIQGVAVPLTQLRELSAMLMDMHGQHEHQSLLDDKNHLHCLDSLGDGEHEALMAETARLYGLYHEAHASYSRLKRESQNRDEKLKTLHAQEEELSAANLTEGEEEQLTQERDRYRSSEKITEALREANASLQEAAGGRAMIEQARGAMRALSAVERLGADYAELYKRAEALYYDAEDLGITVRNMLDAMNDDPERAAYVEERLDLIRKLSRKYGPTTKDMLSALDRIREELSQYESIEASLDRAKKKAQEAYREYYSAARTLSEHRKLLASRFEKRMEEQLNDLNMRGTRFFVEFSQENSVPSALGIDQVRFLIAPNAGEEPKPLSKIASGGELSRVMLSLKALSAERAEIPSMVFDEIDTGISGRTAQVVGQKMWDIARYRQVICVTHLQQIAAMATRHYVVSKAESEGRTHTSVREMTGEERVQEIARMLSGVSENSDTGLIHARHMLDEAAAYRSSTP
ncbi:MAG: DNA repair protein RecN [Clostridia bacterium]|nr:DNA repair protein RecN [Clostridia bacterium]